MGNAFHNGSKLLGRSLSGLCVAAFVFLLVYTAPHRVHHFFDRAQTAKHHHSDHEHETSDRQDKSAADSNCVFQTAANRCAYGLSVQGEPATLALFVQSPIVFQQTTSPEQFLAGSFQIRAPPTF
jgi:hypothetical protein